MAAATKNSRYGGSSKGIRSGTDMGTTFMNLQLKAGREEIPKDRLFSGYVVRQTAEEWSSVFETGGGLEWGKLCKLGRSLSKELDIPVIAVSYFDDDEFSMSLIQGGKTAASYRADVSRSFCSGSAKWISGMKMTAEEASAFRYLLKKEMTAGESITAFSRLFGANMYIDLRMWEETGVLWRKDADGLIREIAEEKRRTRVKNRTKAVLLEEISGLIQSYDERTGILRMVIPDERGNFQFSRIHCLDTSDNGLEEIYSYEYPPDLFRADSRNLHMDYEHKCIMVMDVEGYYREYDLPANEKRLTSLMEIPKEKRRETENRPVISAVYTRSAVDQGRYEYFGRYGCGKDELRKVDLALSGKTFGEKKIVAVYPYEEPDREDAFWSCEEKIPVVTKNGIIDLRVICVKKSKEEICCVCFFDRNLKLLRREEITLNEDVFGFKYAYCEETDCIYFGNKKIDLKTHEVKSGMKELKEADRLFVHRDAENHSFLYAVRGSYVYVLDMDLNLLSCHRLKGRVMYFYTGKEGNIRLITTGDEVWADGKPDKNSAVRLYEIG